MVVLKWRRYGDVSSRIYQDAWAVSGVRSLPPGSPKFGLTPTLRSGATGNWPARNHHANATFSRFIMGPCPTDQLLGTDSIHEVALRSGLQTAPHPIMDPFR